MNVRSWLVERADGVPEPLQRRMVEALGDQAAAPSDRAPDVCLDASVRLLASLVRERRFGRESAIDLLAVDALMTYAYEFASLNGMGGLRDFAGGGVRAVAGISATRQ